MRFPNDQCLDYCCSFLYLFIQGFINTKTNSISVILLCCGYNLKWFLDEKGNEVRILDFERKRNQVFFGFPYVKLPFLGLETTPVFTTCSSAKHQHLKMVSWPYFTSRFKVCWFSSHRVGWEDEEASASSFWQLIIHFQAATMPRPPLNALPQCSFNPKRARASGIGQDWMNELAGYISRLSHRLSLRKPARLNLKPQSDHDGGYDLAFWSQVFLLALCSFPLKEGVWASFHSSSSGQNRLQIMITDGYEEYNF